MCFKNLPIEFDERGNARLIDGVRNPYAYETRSLDDQGDQLKDLLARNGHIKTVDFDPITRVAGALAFHSVVDLQERRVLETNSVATLFRGYEVILKGRDPRDAAFISSRACGVCGGVHSTTSALAMEMAFPVTPPPLGIIVRNLALALEFWYDNPLHLFLLAGPDYSQSIVEITNPNVWEQAKTAAARHTEVHGYRTVGEIMTDLNPLTGGLYLNGLQMTRVAREAYVLIGGKYPHPETVIPGGMSTTVTLSTFNEILSRLRQLFDYCKRTVAIWDDLCDFFYDVNPEYKKVGWRPANLIDPGIWDDPFAYDASYENCNEWGERRWATPGVVVDGELVTTKLQALNIGMEEFIEHSYYEQWDSPRFDTDPAGNPISPHHMWNKETKPSPSGQNWREKYSWSTAPRWDRKAMEGECSARLWITGAANILPHRRFLEPNGHGLTIHVPESTLPAMDLEYRIPDVWNAFERNRGRAYHLAYVTVVAFENWLTGMDLLKQGKDRIHTPFETPRKGSQIGVGFWGAGRGFLTHHATIDNGALSNYQIVTPSTWNASPKDPWGNPGPYEESVLNTPILEEFDGPDSYKGIDILRTIRSFDPCMPCTTHIHVDGSDHVIMREVNTCGCGLDA
ncbi:MAG TPA: nickel-dependent hydrogenase large subunit [Thermomicrobiales bacterium]|nr:nickel-dependent hydrogenase large subunit [Thermomicrobiales bacterium]